MNGKLAQEKDRVQLKGLFNDTSPTHVNRTSVLKYVTKVTVCAVLTFKYKLLDLEIEQRYKFSVKRVSICVNIFSSLPFGIC